MINIETVASDLQSSGWTLLSNNYHNLSTELLIKCPRGHQQTQTYKSWRKHKSCAECDRKIINAVATPPEKSQGKNRILALDAATVISGYSVYDNKDLVAYGKLVIKKDDNTTKRINQIKHWMRDKVKEWSVDFVGIEGIQLQSYGSRGPQVELYRVLSNLQGVLIDECYELQKPTAIVSSSVWREYCDIKGANREAKKRAAKEKVKELHNLDCSDDEADAICLGKYLTEYYIENYSGWGEKVL